MRKDSRDVPRTMPPLRSRARKYRLQTAAIAAETQRAIGIDRHMTEIAGHSAVAAKNAVH